MLAANYLSLVDRYREIIPDLAKMVQVCMQPLPQCFYTNEIKLSVPHLQRLLTREALSYEKMPWCGAGFRMSATSKLGKNWLYLAGLVQIQEEVSMLPVHLLKPQPGDMVLDLCAAPGNKTAQMAVDMRNQGLIVANDCRYARMKAMGQIIRRLGLANVNVTINDGRSLPCPDNTFDKILVDAPCSCEGTLRKSLGKLVHTDVANSQRMAKLQQALLAKAITLLRPGGTLVYSTCTFAPEENEAVVDAVLNLNKQTVELLPIEVPQFNFSSGLTAWNGHKFSQQLANCMRVWPHQNNTGGFFVAYMRKKDQINTLAKKIKYSSVMHEEVKPYVAHVQARYGFSNLSTDYCFYAPSKRGFYITLKENQPQNVPALDKIKFDSVGLFFMKVNTRFPKLSTGAAFLLGAKAISHKVVLDRRQRDGYVCQESCILAPEQMQACDSTGYVLVYYNSICLGVGLLFWRDGAEAELKSLFPRNL